jgi:hypothetical protein
LEVIDLGPVRSPTTGRREVKFTLPHTDVGTLRRLLLGNGRPVVFQDQVSTVRSVYFDDARLSACQANFDGIAPRAKLRLRWYDALRPGHECYLELKWRNNRVTGKHRLHLRSPEPIGALPYRAILARLAEVAPSELLPALAAHPEPIVLVEYRREHFASPDRRVRATLDYRLVYYDQTGRQRICTSFGQPHEGFAVLEGKMPLGGDAELRALLHPFAARAHRCSKYVHACQMLHLVR